MVTQKT